MRAVSVRSFCDASMLLGSVGLIAIAVSLCAPLRLVTSTFLPTRNGAVTLPNRVGTELRIGTVLRADPAAARPPSPIGTATRVATASALAPSMRHEEPFLIPSPFGSNGQANLIALTRDSQKELRTAGGRGSRPVPPESHDFRT